MNQDHHTPDSDHPITPWTAAFLDAALDAIVVSDAEGRILEFNRAAEQTFGYSRDEVLGKLMSDTFIPPALREPHRLGLERYQRTGIPKILRQRLELPAIHRDGTELFVELTVVKIDIPGPARFIGYLRDISDAKRAEEALKLTQFSVDRAGDAVFWVRPDATIAYANDQACQSLGYDQQELLDMSLLDFSPSFPPEEWEAHWNETKERRSFSLESIHQRKNGDCFPVQINVNYIEYGGREYNCAFVRDISNTKRFEQSLKTALSAAQTANKAKSEFLAVISHEMRTPLNVVLGLTSELKETPLQDDFRDQIRDGDKSARDLLRLIEDVLHFSQAEAGRIVLRRSMFDLSQLLGSILSRFEYRAKQAGLLIEHECDEQLPKSIFGDDGRLRQVLDNLLNNAIKFTSSGRIRMACKVLATTDEDVELEFSVDDSGIGVDEADRERIFNRFTQADGSDARQHSGVGLGLAICKQLVRLMDGRIHVEDSELGGSRFVFSVRAGLKELVETETKLAEAVLSDDQLAELAGRRVLIVEDSPPNQRLVERMLTTVDIRIETADSGLEALIVLEKQQGSTFDLILMDLMMPDMDGIECTQRIRSLQNSEINQIPIVAMTARAMDGDREECLEAGMNDYITKPINRQLVLARIYEQVIGPLPSTTNPKSPTFRELLRDQRLPGIDEDPDFIVEILELCIQVCDEAIPFCRDALAAKDMKNLAFYSHKMKGSLENIHAGPMTIAAKELMTAAEGFESTGNRNEAAFEECDVLFARVLDEWGRLKPQFLDLKSQLC